jgi:outer membrane protein
MNEEINSINEEQPQSIAEAPSQAIPLKEDDNLSESRKPLLNRLIILNIILMAGLVILYILFFTEGRNKVDNSMKQAIVKANQGSISVAFVNNDSLLANYDLVIKLKKELQTKGDNYSADVASKQKSFEKDAAYFQEQVQKKAISEQSAQEIYSSLMENQQKIYDLRDKYASELQQSESDMNIALLDSVMNFLKRYNQKYKFDYILGFNKGGNIVFANDTLDITHDVLRELNQEYKSMHPVK